MARKRKSDTLSQETSGIKRQKSDDFTTLTQSTNGRAGRVVNIYLRNFMCHSALEINFDLNTNYIIGRNGSGKSAILTALIVGLGGKARATNRGANTKSFIKAGEDSATLEITLSNTGPMAYEPKIYGSEIKIVRSIHETAGNSYKIKAADGHVVSSAFRDVNRIVAALNIHVDNPVCILNQDVARTFLNSNDPAKKYIMFMKATNLESVKQQYKIALQNKKKTNMVLHLKIDEMKKLEEDVKKWLKKYEAFKNATKVEEKEKKLGLEAIWAQINLIEGELKIKEDNVEKLEVEVKNFADLVTNKDEAKSNLTQNVDQIRKQLLEIRNEEEINQTTMNSKKNKLVQLRDQIVSKKNDNANIENLIERKTNDKKTIEIEISRSSEYQKTKMKLIEKRDTEVRKAEQKQNEIVKMFETAENDANQMKNAVNMKTREQNSLSNELQDISIKVKQREAKMRSVKTEDNSISVYGPTMKRIVEQMNAHKEQFKCFPKGPVGSFIKLKEKKWALAIEQFIGTGTLMSFCVDNAKDSQILTNILRKICGARHPTVICSKFFNKMHNFSANKTDAPDGCVAMIDTVIIKDPVIMNCIIDQTSIENILLIPDNKLAREIMSNKRRVPRKCYRALTLTGDVFYPDPSYRFYACRTGNARFLQINSSDIVRSIETEIRAFAEKEETVRRQLVAVSNDVRRLTGELRVLDNKLNSLGSARTRIEREIRDIKSAQLPPEPNLQILAEELEEIGRILEVKKRELQKNKEDREMLKTELSEMDNEYKELKNISKNLETRMKPLIEEMSECEDKLRQIHINTKRQQDNLKKATDRFTIVKKEYELKKKFLNTKMEEALKLGERVKTKRSVEAVLKELEDVRQQLADLKSSLGDKLTISRTYMRVQEKYDKVKNEVTQVKTCLGQMVEAVESRARMYHRLAEYIGVRVREMFSGVLRLRQFKGTIEIDHEKQTLELVVIPRHGSSQSTGQTHILSGGERSYATVAFLHALWQVMEYPFYFLDEFDVFMDKVNRRTVMDILLEHAKEHKDLQFVFLTPQDCSNIAADKNITVHRMADPKSSNN